MTSSVFLKYLPSNDSLEQFILLCDHHVFQHFLVISDEIVLGLQFSNICGYLKLKYYRGRLYAHAQSETNQPRWACCLQRDILCNLMYFKCIFFRIRNKPVSLEVKKATKEPSGSLTTKSDRDPTVEPKVESESSHVRDHSVSVRREGIEKWHRKARERYQI